MIDKKLSLRDITALILTILSSFGGAWVYAEKRLDTVKTEAKTQISQEVDTVEKQVEGEKQERQESVRLMNAKLDIIINILANQKRGS